MNEHVQAEMARARKSPRAARLLCDEGLLEDAISRSYYAAMHAAKAALLIHGIAAGSHAAVRRLFGKELVAPGRPEREWSAVLAAEQDQRAMADYDAQARWETSAAEGMVQNATRFVDRIASYLSAEVEPTEETDGGEGPEAGSGAAGS